MPRLTYFELKQVRKADLRPRDSWERWTSTAVASPEEADTLRVLALDAQSGRPIGERLTGHTYLHPPMVHRLGSVVVVRAPDADRHPSREYRVKRVVGLGGQLCRARGEPHRLERVPPFALWVEGDNPESGGDEPSDSRTWGALRKNNVIGIAERVVWPPSRWGAVVHAAPLALRSWW